MFFSQYQNTFKDEVCDTYCFLLLLDIFDIQKSNDTPRLQQVLRARRRLGLGYRRAFKRPLPRQVRFATNSSYVITQRDSTYKEAERENDDRSFPAFSAVI